jgi:uncharacterized protein YegJ (DUF2314 family)
MGLLSKLFGKKKGKIETVIEREGHPDVVNVPNEDERMNRGIEKAKLTLGYIEKSLRSPKPTQSYFSIKIKIEDGDSSEHLWLNSPEFDKEGNLFGRIGNKPVYVTTVKENQKVGITKDIISDWMIIEEGKLIGGYTIRAIREGMKEKDRKAFDQSVGLYIDEGVDYFEHNFETPEGAILCLEDAFDEKNIEKAVDCKDFHIEAELMLQMKMPVEDQEIIESTAEVLKLSFIKSLQDEGMPDFKNLKRAFPSREKINENHYVITEICWYPDGGKSVQKLGTYKTARGWRVLAPVE